MLNHGCSKVARSKNIGRLLREGKPIKQAVAIASKVQREHCSCRTSRGPRGGRKMTCTKKRRRA